MISYSGDRRKDMPRRPFMAKNPQVGSKINWKIGLMITMNSQPIYCHNNCKLQLYIYTAGWGSNGVVCFNKTLL